MRFRPAALVPAYNESSTITKVVAGVRPHVDLVLVVDDGSTDGTAGLAEAAGATVLRHTSNQGKGHAVRSGLAAILSGDFTHVLLMDGDMQHLPSEAPRLLEAARSTGADLVVGERVFSRQAMPAWRLSDTQCGYRIFNTDIVRRMKLQATGYDIETEMLVKLGRLGGRMAHVQVSAVYGGVSKLRPVRDTTRTCFRALYYRYLEPL